MRKGKLVWSLLLVMALLALSACRSATHRWTAMEADYESLEDITLTSDASTVSLDHPFVTVTAANLSHCSLSCGTGSSCFSVQQFRDGKWMDWAPVVPQAETLPARSLVRNASFEETLDLRDFLPRPVDGGPEAGEYRICFFYQPHDGPKEQVQTYMTCAALTLED